MSHQAPPLILRSDGCRKSPRFIGDPPQDCSWRASDSHCHSKASTKDLFANQLAPPENKETLRFSQGDNRGIGRSVGMEQCPPPRSYWVEQTPPAPILSIRHRRTLNQHLAPPDIQSSLDCFCGGELNSRHRPTVADALRDLSMALDRLANTLDKASPNLLVP